MISFISSGVLDRAIPHSVATPKFGAYLLAAAIRFVVFPAPSACTKSGEHRLHDSSEDVGEAEIPALESVSQFRVIDPE